jgi:cytochrome bd-type quinol oxidase subunit 1
MIDFVIGVAIGTAFAPFWMMVYNSYIKPQFAKLFPPKK